MPRISSGRVNNVAIVFTAGVMYLVLKLCITKLQLAVEQVKREQLPSATSVSILRSPVEAMLNTAETRSSPMVCTPGTRRRKEWERRDGSDM